MIINTLTIDINKSAEVIISTSEHTLQIRLIRIKTGGGREYLATVDFPLSCAGSVLQQGVSLHSSLSNLIITRESDDLVFSVAINAKVGRNPHRVSVIAFRKMLEQQT